MTPNTHARGPVPRSRHAKAPVPSRPGRVRNEPAEDTTEGGKCDARCHAAGAPRGRRALRPPDQTVEPEDAPVPLRGAIRYLHRRSRTDPDGPQGGLRLRP